MLLTLAAVLPVNTPVLFIAWFLIGLVTGFLASVVFRSGYGLVGKLVSGVSGAAIGGFFAIFIGFFGGFGNILISFLGSCISLASLQIIAAITTSSPRIGQKNWVEEGRALPEQKGTPLPPVQPHKTSSASFSPPTLSIFLSHSSKDDEFGLRLVNDLRKVYGSSEAVWYDSEGGLYGGDSWWSRIVAVLANCDVFIIVLSPNSMNSKWVIRELDIAMIEGKRVVPVLYHPCDIRSDLRAIQTISFLAPIKYETAFNKLLQALTH